MSERPDLTSLAGSVADGAPVNWPDAGGNAASQNDLQLLEGLRLLEQIAEVHASASASWTIANRERSASAATRIPRTLDPAHWGPLVIVDRIGRGTFGTVYRAWDPRLDRHVALKLLDESSSDSIVNEGRLMARVRHPGVVTVHGADRHDGRVGIWMELVEGRTLDAEVRERGPLAAEEVARIGADIADALAAVHRAGLVHRDVKAQNVMHQPDGRIVLMDFGTGTGADASEDPGLAGTPLYLAPELVEGGTATTRSDVYSLGVLLYHLASASFPVSGRTLREVRRAHARGERRPVSEARPGLPSALERVIDRALSDAPAARFQDASTLAEALRQLVRAPARRRQRAIVAGVAAATLVFGALAAWWLGGLGSVRGQLRFAPMDAVLIARFDNHTGDPVFDGAIEYALERELLESKVVGLVPLQRVHDALQHMRRPLDTVVDRVIGREIAVRDGLIKAVLAGQVSRSGDSYTLTAELVSPQDGQVVASFVETAQNRGEVTSALARHARRIRESLGEHLSVIPVDATPEPGTTRSLEAFLLYNQSHRLGRDGKWPESIALARRAVAADGEFASGWIWLAWGLSRIAPNRSAEEAIRNAARLEIPVASERALTLSQTLPEWERHWIRGTYHFLRGDWQASLEPYKTLLTLRPDHYVGASNLNSALLMLNRRGEITALFSRIADLHPLDPQANLRAAGELLAARRGERAARPYVERARAVVAGSRVSREVAEMDLWIALFDTYVDWLKRDITSASARVDAIVQQFNGPPESGSIRYPMAYRAGNFYVSLGRLAQAEQTFLMGNPTERDRHLRAIPRPGNAELAPVDLSSETVDLLRETVGRLPPTGGDYQRACRRLAKALVLLGRPHDAVTELERCVAEEPLLAPPLIGFFGTTAWMRARLDLADLYRNEGRISDAKVIESDLRALLAVADSDHPVLQKLAGR